MYRGIWTAALLLAVTTAGWAQANPPKGAAGKVDQADVDAAIKKGAEFLKSRGGGFSDSFLQSELVVLTLLHADVPVNEAPLEEGIKWVKGLDVEKLGFRDKVYRIGIASMALWSLSAQTNQEKLAQFAYFLVANQGEQGEWDYGVNVELPKELKPPDEPGAIVSGGEGGTVKLPPKKPGGGSQVQKRIPINPKRIGTDHDYSNMQYALLGLRACAEAGCVIPEKTWKDALKNLEAGQFPEGAWGYAWLMPANMAPGTTLTHGDKPYGSMTCSGLCGTIICRHFLKEDWKKDKKVAKAKEWIGKNFSVEEHPKYDQTGGIPMAGGKKQFYYYYLYSLERAGMLADTEVFGGHDWYNEGAKVLLAQQQADGSWPDDEMKNGNIDDTCFAILFLRRATQPIVPKRISK